MKGIILKAKDCFFFNKVCKAGITRTGGKPYSAGKSTMTEFCYYPGCTLKTKAAELDENARAAAKELGITMTEPPDWQCCGAVYPLAKDEIATRLSSVRVLDYAKKTGQDVLTLCSACHHVIKRVNNDMSSDEDIQAKVNNYLKTENTDHIDYRGEVRVVHYLEMLRDTVGFDKLKEKVSAPFTGKKIAAYYGCLLLRPGSVMEFDDPENPKIIEEFIRAIGADPVIYAYRNECCGGYVAVEDSELSGKMCKNVIDSAGEKGAEAIITACPLCLYNLNENGQAEARNIPVYYFTELLAAALGILEKKGVLCDDE